MSMNIFTGIRLVLPALMNQASTDFNWGVGEMKSGNQIPGFHWWAGSEAKVGGATNI